MADHPTKCEMSSGVDYSALQPKIKICGQPVTCIMRRHDFPWEVYVCSYCCVSMIESGHYNVVEELDHG